MSSLEPVELFPSELLKARLINIKERIKAAAEKSSRSPDSICLVAVTKSVQTEQIKCILDLDVQDIGESRIQEALAKKRELEPWEAKTGKKISYHMIGHLQTNKAKKAVEFFDLVQSVDRPELAQTLDRLAKERGKTQRCLVEVKISTEASKKGVSLGDAEAFISGFGAYSHLRLEGLMTIAPLGISPDETRSLMKKLSRFFMEQRKHFGAQPILSMGMSDDFEIAIEEGANMVRIGRALFGERVD